MMRSRTQFRPSQVPAMCALALVLLIGAAKPGILQAQIQPHIRGRYRSDPV